MQTLQHALRKRWIRFSISAALVILGIILLQYAIGEPAQTAVSKGGPYLEVATDVQTAVDQSRARDLARSAPQVADLLAGSDNGFLYALPLSANEARAWGPEGCTGGSCAQVTFYDYDRGGTIQAIVEMASGRLIDAWSEPEARPGASPQMLPRAISIAAEDPRVTAVLGDVRLAEPAMVPMSAWLEDDDCARDWCVDLTFPAPDKSGRIFHAMINMEREEVARVFYTRGRPDVAYTPPSAQGGRYNDGCHEQYGWEVCWEMTAHDGVDFFDARYGGQPVFSSAKIGQVEVYYPSWPGGYRDEIGFSSSVPPYYGTDINDLGNGFEVRQLFTEFLRWPNCICCYRYEQIMRFYSDGSFEPSFISHGPGCDDLSTYRPFWRIDLDLSGAEDDTVWVWGQDGWQEAATELQIPLFENLSPQGYKFFTGGTSANYFWQSIPTDPLGLDEGRVYLIRWHEGEGDGPIAAGPADSFWPPGQWLDDEPLSGQNFVLWYIPILKTRKGDPWWCMPDPEPDFSPCNADLRAVRMPNRALLTESVPSPTPLSADQATSIATHTPAPTPTPRPIAGQDPETIILNSGCGACHVIGVLGEAGKVGPDLSNIGREASGRSPGLTAEEYLRQSILEPGAFIAPRCPNGPCLDGIMPRDYAQRLSPQQLDILVNFLLVQGMAATPLPPTGTPPPVAPTTTPAKVGPSPEGRAGSVPDDSLWTAIILAAGIVLLLAMLRVTRRSDSPPS